MIIQDSRNQGITCIRHINKQAQHYKDVYLSRINIYLDVQKVTKISELYSYIRTFVLYYGRPFLRTSKRCIRGKYQYPSLTQHPHIFHIYERHITQCFQYFFVRVTGLYVPGLVCGPCISVVALASTTANVLICCVPAALNIPGFRPVPAPSD